MTRTQFKAARSKLEGYEGLAWGAEQKALGEAMRSDTRTLRRWEKGERTIPGPAEGMMILLVWLKEQGSLHKALAHLRDERKRLSQSDIEEFTG